MESTLKTPGYPSDQISHFSLQQGLLTNQKLSSDVESLGSLLPCHILAE